MTAGSPAPKSLWTRTTVLLLLVVVLVTSVSLSYAQSPEDRRVPPPPTVAEKLFLLQAERAELQARAGGLARIEMLSSFRAASLLLDALASRYEPEREQPFDRLPAAPREVFARLEAVNAAMRAATDRPGIPEGAAAASEAASGIPKDLEWLASFDFSPVILSYTPKFLMPRSLMPLGDDTAIEIEVLGLGLTRDQTPPVLTIGSWRGEAAATAERLKFVVPRSAFASEAQHPKFASGTLFLRHDSRTVAFQLLFTAIPRRAGSVLVEQKVRTPTLESKTLVSPEILARAPAGEAKTVRRCFDPPPGWRFDKSKRRADIVERLGWMDDIPDETMNSGSVAFVREDRPGQICVAVVAKAATKAARTATIGRFEATLVRDVETEQVVQGGRHSLDWTERVRIPLQPGTIEWKLHIRLFDEIDREFDGKGEAATVRSGFAFLDIAVDGDRMLTLRADPEALR
jgi:hypothetical protein